MQFVVEEWAVLAPGFPAREPWLDHGAVPDIAWLPAALRRRVSPLGRAALSVMAACQSPDPCPVVFASRYGDLQASGELLAQLHREGGVSPTGFSLAVHNSAVGIYSIARHDRASTTSIAAHSDLAEAACFEALGLLTSGAAQVLVVCCDDPVPPPYRADSWLQDFRYAWACRLRTTEAGGLTLEVARDDESAHDVGGLEYPELRALSFLAGNGGRALKSETGRYIWRRHDQPA